jgi:hypothetical protein
MAPIVHGLEVEYFDRINFIYLDIDDPNNETYKKQLGFIYQPHFLLLDREGNVLQQWLGPVTAEEFREGFDSHLP